jgi:hypothetical protein
MLRSQDYFFGGQPAQPGAGWMLPGQLPGMQAPPQYAPAPVPRPVPGPAAPPAMPPLSALARDPDEMFFDSRTGPGPRRPGERAYQDTPAEIFAQMRALYPNMSQEDLVRKVRKSMDFMRPREQREGGDTSTPEDILSRIPAS